VERKRLDHADREAMSAWLAGQPAGTPVALEAAFGWPWVADLLEALGLEPHLAHPPAVRVLAKHQAKTDRCDADRLAEFQLTGILPESYLAPPHVRQLRERTRYRMALSKLRTGLKNRLQAQLHREGILHAFSDLFGKGGREFLAELALPEATREVLDGYLLLLDQVELRLDQVEQWMTQHVAQDEITQLLRSLPGVGMILAHVIQAEVGQIERFPSRRHFASYCGLAPMSDDSAARHGQRHLGQACNRTLRWAFIEAANVVAGVGARHAPRLVALSDRLKRHGRTKGQAKAAVARQLCELAYVVWKKRQPYTLARPSRPGSPSTTQRRNSKISHPRDQRSAACAQPEPESCLPSDQPRRPMVRRKHRAAGQTLK
jgi:transposase